LAVGGSGGTDGYGNVYPAGLMVYHYNDTRPNPYTSPNPPTPYSGVLTKDAILSIHRDKKNHLYALSPTKLYVYTVTPTSITPVATYPIASGKGLFVVPKCELNLLKSQISHLLWISFIEGQNAQRSISD
jgi:hypothetical protein